jgi:hypothetical protein
MYAKGQGVARDELMAYTWALLYAASFGEATDSPEYAKAAAFRKRLAPRLTARQSDEAKRLTPNRGPEAACGC